jgi:hypothetical protein
VPHERVAATDRNGDQAEIPRAALSFRYIEPAGGWENRAMKLRAVLVFLSALSAPALALVPVPTDQEAQRAHAQGSCGSLGPGSGLKDGVGWVVSMLPGRHEFRMRGGGSVFVTVAKKSVLDFDAGRPYYIVIDGARPGAVLEWKIPGSDWGPVSKYFLYPPSGTPYK